MKTVMKKVCLYIDIEEPIQNIGITPAFGKYIEENSQ